jgi:hypothetical protein
MRMAQAGAAVLALVLGGAACASVLGPDPALEKAAPAAFPFAEWNALLSKYVDGEGRVDYQALKANASDSQKFERVFAAVAATGPRTHPERFPTQEAKLAYYLDAYNICVWKNVLTRLPKLTNVDKEKASFFFFTKLVVDGKPINLKDLESDVIRPTFKDGRVHMALNCASGGCPKLPRYAFTPKRVDEQLGREARIFCNERRNVDWDPASHTVRLSHIFDWYKDDFGKEPGKVIGWINSYRAPSSQIPLDAKIVYLDYDWTLNDVHLLKR